MFTQNLLTPKSQGAHSWANAGVVLCCVVCARYGLGLGNGRGAVAEWVRAYNWRPGGPVVRNFASVLCRQFCLSRFASVQCLSEETLKAADPFYLVAMAGEVKDPHRG